MITRKRIDEIIDSLIIYRETQQKNNNIYAMNVDMLNEKFISELETLKKKLKML